MKLLTRFGSKGMRETAAETGREAVKGTGRGARRGAKRGFGFGALRGSAEGTAGSLRGRFHQSRATRRERARQRAEAVRSRGKGSAKAFKTRRKDWANALKANARSVAEAVSPQRRRRSRAKKGAAAAAGGAAAAAGAYFLDPQSGKRRRHVARDRIASFVRRGTAQVKRQAEYRKGHAEGVVEAAKSEARPEKPAANDQQIAERVQSEVFRPADVPKGSINVNVEDGVVYLRGEVEQPEQINDLVEKAGSIDGVKRVESLLHPPKTPAPMKGEDGKGSKGGRGKRKSTA